MDHTIILCFTLNRLSPCFSDVSWDPIQLIEVTIMAGNVVTKEMTEELIFSGADVIKAEKIGWKKMWKG